MKISTRWFQLIAFLTAVFLNAFVDLGHKIIIQNTVFKVYDGQTQIILTAILNALVLLPYILLLSPVGFFADKYPKQQVMKIMAWVAVIITLGITVCYYLGWFWPAFSLTFLLGIQSAFYYPAKIGYIKPFFGEDKLPKGNGYAQATTIIAILVGTFVYSIFFESAYPGDNSSPHQILQAIAPLGWLLVLSSLIEAVMIHRLPTLEQTDKTVHFDWPAYRSGEMRNSNLKTISHSAIMKASIVGLAMFWSVGQVLLAVFPAYAKANFSITNTIVLQGILACAGIGIALGSILAARFSRNHIELRLIPIAAIGLTLGLAILPVMPSTATQIADFLFIGTMGGLFIVPLNALLQYHSKQHELGKVLATNNWVQNIAMIACLLITALSASVGFSSLWLLIFIAVFSMIGSAYTAWKLYK